jgi:hypothetical protein
VNVSLHPARACDHVPVTGRGFATCQPWECTCRWPFGCHSTRFARASPPPSTRRRRWGVCHPAAGVSVWPQTTQLPSWADHRGRRRWCPCRSGLAPRALGPVVRPRGVIRVRCPLDLEVSCHRGLWCPIQADGLDLTGAVVSLARAPLWSRAGRWAIVRSNPSRTLLWVSASRPTPPPRRDVPVHGPTGVGPGTMPVIVRPAANQRGEWPDHRTGCGRWVGFERFSYLAQQGSHTRGGRAREQRPVILPKAVAENVDTRADRRDPGLGRRACQAPFPADVFDPRCDCCCEPCGCPARDAAVIRLADQLALVPTRERFGKRQARRSHPFQSLERQVRQHGRADPPVGRPGLGRPPRVRCHLPRLPPSAADGCIQRAVGPQPVMAALVNTGVAVAFEPPWRGGLVRPRAGAWPHRVRRRAAGATPLRVGVGPRVGAGVEREPRPRWPGPIPPRRHPAIAWAPMARGHRDAAPREGAPASRLSVCHGWRVLLRRIPADVVHARRALAPVGRHSWHGHGATAPRAGEHVWPGPDLAPLPLLLCRHDPALHTTHVPVGSPPVHLVPGPSGTQARARRGDGSHLHELLVLPRPHLLSCAKTTRKSARWRVGYCRSGGVRSRAPSLSAP